MVGHSYGALVAGVAARDRTLPVDDFVAAGDIGLGVSHVSHLNPPADNVWIAQVVLDQ